ncbi:MAG: VWA domain-containing protein [Myxococcales bacterium]|nr:VWA domain-containing protein [Myxococcales bacterium]
MSDLDPITFAVRFTRTMRRQRTAVHTPSLRTSLAIPRWLMARSLRTGGLTPADLVRAAVLCSPPEDQALAEAVARTLVFPEPDAKKGSAIVVAAEGTSTPTGADDPLAAVLGDLASLDVDLEALEDLGDLDALLDDSAEDDDDLGAFALFEGLYSSADPAERALGELIGAFGGPANLEADGIRTRPLAEVWAVKHLLGAVGELTPALVAHGVAAGFGPELQRACTEPWEMAGVLAARADPGLEALLQDLEAEASCRQLGRTLAFLGATPSVADRRDGLARAALSRALDLTDFAELVVGLGEWMDPPDGLIDTAVAVSGPRALGAASWLATTFAVDLRTEVFERWFATQPRAELATLVPMAVDCDGWKAANKDALALEIRRLDAVPTAPWGTAPAVHADVEHAVRRCGELRALPIDAAQAAARQLATAILVRASVPVLFLPLLDALLARGVRPELDPVLARARQLGVSEEEVLDRLGQALEQLRELILQNQRNVDRYQRLIGRISHMPPDLMAQLAARATADGNLEAMAALLAVDMGGAAEQLSAALVQRALGHKGIGSGMNLLKQWFTHQRRLPSAVRDAIKEQVKGALLVEALDWTGKGDGSGERGLVPQQRSRPFRAGDGLDALDLDSTLQAVLGAGKSLDQVTEEDLFASETSRGRAALGVLIDISGSMGGGELAVCAVAVVMLLGKLLPEEVALAVFESDTHVIKPFADVADLDRVADQVLELQATGGTRVDAALQWVADQFVEVTEADVRVLFLLSDFFFAEGEQALTARCRTLSELGVELLAASWGSVEDTTLRTMLQALPGEHLDIKDLKRLPALLLDCLSRIGR